MTDIDEIEKLFEKHEKENKNFERIENPPSNRPDLCAFLLLDKLFPKNEKIISSSEHDGVYLNFSPEEIEKLSEDDVIYLYRCGIFLNSEQSLYYFV